MLGTLEHEGQWEPRNKGGRSHRTAGRAFICLYAVDLGSDPRHHIWPPQSPPAVIPEHCGAPSSLHLHPKIRCLGQEYLLTGCGGTDVRIQAEADDRPVARL